jgi:hypothetical protein
MMTAELTDRRGRTRVEDADASWVATPTGALNKRFTLFELGAAEREGTRHLNAAATLLTDNPSMGERRTRTVVNTASTCPGSEGPQDAACPVRNFSGAEGFLGTALEEGGDRSGRC